MVGLGWSIALLLVMGTLAFQRASLVIWTISLALYFILATVLVGATVTVIIGWLLFLLIFTPLNIPSVRKKYLSGPLFKFYRKVMPTMSRTEREAIAAGTVAWEGDLFRGNPDWKKLLGFKAPTLSAEEQAFMDGPVEKLCQMINDWDITHTRMDLSPEMWAFVKEQGFFGLIIPKQYGGKQFSAYAHSQILVKISGKSLTVSSTVAVPNALWH
jgi:acyl-CoA dehydrogenase